jgi:adenylosuccinate lyase
MVTAWQMAAGIVLERSLKDSASKRTWLPMSFADIDQCLVNAEKLVGGLTLNEKRIKVNLDKYAPFFCYRTDLGGSC